MNLVQLVQKNFKIKNVLYAILAAGLAMSIYSCGKSNFTGEAVETPSGTPSPLTTPPSCQNSTVQTGVQLAFVIDNSGSNLETDCVGGSQTGRCTSATQREKSVLSAFDYLQPSSVAATTATAKSQVAIASFPNSQNSFQIQSTWSAIENTAQRATLEKSLTFTRSPNGATPYAAVIAAGTELFKTAANDGRPKVLILVTDGEPTDRNPIKVRDAAAALSATGVELYSIFITSGVNKDARVKAHLAALQTYENDALPGHYYDSTAYKSFTEYTNNVLGLNGKKSSLEEISKTIISIDKADQLQSTIQALVKSKTECK